METLTTVAKIKPDREAALRTVLAKIAADPAGNDYMRLGLSQSAHFIRMVIMDDPDNGPRLLFASNYDGQLPLFFQEIVDISPDLDAVWSACEGYSGPSTFGTFMARNSFPAQAVYLGFPNETVTSLRAYRTVRRELERIFDLNDVSRYLDGPDINRLMSVISGIPASQTTAQRVGDLAEAATATLGRLAQSTFRDIFLWGAQKFSESNADFSHVITISPEGEARRRETEQAIDVPARAGYMLQNEMTTLTTVRPECLPRLRFALAASRALFRFGYSTGEFADVGSLHIRRREPARLDPPYSRYRRGVIPYLESASNTASRHSQRKAALFG